MTTTAAPRVWPTAWVLPFGVTLLAMFALQLSNLGFSPLLPSIQREFDMSYTQGKAGIKTISTSQYLRTKHTADPLAKQLGIANTIIPVKMDTMNSRQLSPEYLKQISDLIASSAGNVFIVGHSNTVPELIKALGGDIVPTIDDATYDDLFVVTVYAKGKAKVAHLKQ
jgi:hypothetical protein